MLGGWFCTASIFVQPPPLTGARSVSPGASSTSTFCRSSRTTESTAEVTVNDSAESDPHGGLALARCDGNGDESLFLYLHTLHPHNPYTPPEPFPSRFVSAKAVACWMGGPETLVAIRDLEREGDARRTRKWVRQRYTANLAYNDAELCELVDGAGASLSLGEVMLVVTSDHGEELFDHDGVLHGYTLYDEMLHVPLVVWWPGQGSPNGDR